MAHPGSPGGVVETDNAQVRWQRGSGGGVGVAGALDASVHLQGMPERESERNRERESEKERDRERERERESERERDEAGDVMGRGTTTEDDGEAGGDSDMARWLGCLDNLRAAEEAVKGLEALLVGPSALYVDERVMRSVRKGADSAQLMQTHQRRMDAVQDELAAAVDAAADARAALRRSEEERVALQQRLQQVERELETTSGVFEVYTSELRARQTEVEKRCEEVRVLQAIIRTLSDNKDASKSFAAAAAVAPPSPSPATGGTSAGHSTRGSV